MEKSDITAIIPIFNEESYIKRSLESILSQTLRPKQILIVDDGSTDKSAAIVKEYATDGVEYVYQDNGGLACARNTGIKNSRSQYVGFLDADDQWKENIVVDMTALFERYPDLAWACAPYEKVLEDGTVDFIRRIPGRYVVNELIQDYFEASARFHFSLPSATFVKRSVFEHVGGFDTSISEYGEDQDMWFRIALSYPQIGYTSQVGTVYWHRKGSLMDKHPRNVERALMRIHKTESHAAYIGGEKLRKCEPVILEWVLYEMREAAIQGNRTALEHISRYYGRRLSVQKRVLLSLFRGLPFAVIWRNIKQLLALSRRLKTAITATLSRH